MRRRRWRRRRRRRRRGGRGEPHCSLATRTLPRAAAGVAAEEDDWRVARLAPAALRLAPAAGPPRPDARARTPPQTLPPPPPRPAGRPPLPPYANSSNPYTHNPHSLAWTWHGTCPSAAPANTIREKRECNGPKTGNVVDQKSGNVMVDKSGNVVIPAYWSNLKKAGM
jgi:hypothetical protein